MNRLIFIILFGFIASSTYGQFYIQPSIGYTFSSHPTEIQSIKIVDNLKTVYNNNLKYGEGIQLGLNAGCDLWDYFFFEVNTKKTIYSKYNVSIEQKNLRLLNNFSFRGYFGEIDYESSVFQISPLIGFKVEQNRYAINLKIGPNFMKSTITQTLTYIDWEFDNWERYPLNTIKKYAYSGKFQMGLQVDLGFCYSLKENLQLVVDFVTVYNNFKNSKSAIKYYEIDGVNHLYKMDETNTNDDFGNLKLNHSHNGINVGIKYVFNK